MEDRTIMEYALLIVVIVGVVFFRTPVGKGILGEFQVKLFLGKNKPNQQYVIHNLMIVNEGKSSQIDHLLINRSGIFVIETKNYAGRIYGEENQKEWTQVFQYGKVKNHFYNPILQNRTHIYALSQLLNRKDCFYSIIVFPKAKLMTNTTTDVGKIGLVRKKIRSETSIIFTEDEMNEIYAKLNEIKLHPAVTNRQHVKEIHQMKQKIEQNICPRCGKPLLLKEGKYGSFYGCSGYPQCTFKKKA